MDYATRLAYVEVLPDELQSTTVGLLVRAVGWFGEHGMTCGRILSDNGTGLSLWCMEESLLIHSNQARAD